MFDSDADADQMDQSGRAVEAPPNVHMVQLKARDYYYYYYLL